MARPPAGPPRAMSPLQEAMALHQRGKLNPARMLYREVVARQPNNADALELLGLAAAELGDYAEAIRVLSRAAVANPKSLNVQFNLGMAHKQLRHWAEAETNIREAVRIGPVQAEMLTALGARPLCVGEREAQAAAAPARRLRGARRPFFSQLRPAGRLQTDSSPGPASAGCGRCTPGSIRRARSRCRASGTGGSRGPA